MTPLDSYPFGDDPWQFSVDVGHGPPEVIIDWERRGRSLFWYHTVKQHENVDWFSHSPLRIQNGQSLSGDKGICQDEFQDWRHGKVSRRCLLQNYCRFYWWATILGEVVD